MSSPAGGHQVHADGRAEPGAEGDELQDDELAEQRVEHAPDAVPGAGRERARDGDAHERAHEVALVEPPGDRAQLRVEQCDADDPLGRGDSQTGDSLQHDASPLFGDPLTDQR